MINTNSSQFYVFFAFAVTFYAITAAISRRLVKNAIWKLNLMERQPVGKVKCKVNIKSAHWPSVKRDFRWISRFCFVNTVHAFFYSALNDRRARVTNFLREFLGDWCIDIFWCIKKLLISRVVIYWAPEAAVLIGTMPVIRAFRIYTFDYLWCRIP